MKMAPDTLRRHLDETALCLRREGYAVERLPDERLVVTDDYGLLCTIDRPGSVSYRQGDMLNPEIEASKDRAFEIVDRVAQYMRLMDRAPGLKASGLNENYRTLADFNGTVLAGAETKYGVNFVTWDWDFNHEGLSHGHYYAHDYDGAKKDFALRSNLIDKSQLFNAEQLIEIYRCCCDTLEAGYELTSDQERTISGVKEQITDIIPDISEQIRAQQRLEDSVSPEMSM